MEPLSVPHHAGPRGTSVTGAALDPEPHSLGEAGQGPCPVDSGEKDLQVCEHLV